ncbi:StbB family protein [Paraburkholderia sp. MM6662-R1]|uniref:StbB family protein n=1 Tax=Paraburkholderia sp. MM6662-R1 TaxID=2991066 RepID=UPI003D1E6472
MRHGRPHRSRRNLRRGSLDGTRSRTPPNTTGRPSKWNRKAADRYGRPRSSRDRHRQIEQQEQDIMKIAVINFSGNVGKSTVARHLLAPRLEGAQVIAIESINSDDHEKEDALRGSQFDELQEQMMMLKNVVVDVGASNVEDFIGLMQRYDGSHEDFDIFVVPTVPVVKQQVDTIATLDELRDLGVRPDRIRLLFNTVDTKSDLRKAFLRIFDHHQSKGGFVLNNEAVIYENPIFEKIKPFDRSIFEIRDDPTDYVAWNAKAMEEGAPEAQRAYIRQMVALKRLANRAASELDAVFDVLVH